MSLFQRGTGDMKHAKEICDIMRWCYAYRVSFLSIEKTKCDHKVYAPKYSWIRYLCVSTGNGCKVISISNRLRSFIFLYLFCHLIFSFCYFRFVFFSSIRLHLRFVSLSKMMNRTENEEITENMKKMTK